jgi:hypothetical protein
MYKVINVQRHRTLESFRELEVAMKASMTLGNIAGFWRNTNEVRYDHPEHC